MFNKGETVVYPRHGLGKISKLYYEEVGPNKVKYYEINFIDSPITLSIPVNDAEQLGLRYPYSRKSLKDALKKFNRALRVGKSDSIDDLDTYSKDKFKSGKIEDIIEVFNYIKTISRQKKEVEKKLTPHEQETQEEALRLLQSEVCYVLGKKSVMKEDTLS